MMMSTANKTGTSTGSVENGWSKYVVFLVGPEKEKMFGLKSQLIAKSQAFSEIVYAQGAQVDNL